MIATATMTRHIRYRDEIYTTEELQQRLELELARLYQQLETVEQNPSGTRDIVVRTYKDMIRQREELFSSLD